MTFQYTVYFHGREQLEQHLQRLNRQGTYFPHNYKIEGAKLHIEEALRGPLETMIMAANCHNGKIRIKKYKGK